jgi:hypothetical protein
MVHVSSQINIISVIGLIIDIIGVLILFKHGLPIEKDFAQTAFNKLGLDRDLWLESVQHRWQQKDEKKWAIRGLKFVLAGFVLQMVATFLVWSF